MNARHFATGVRHLGALGVCAVWLLTPAPRAAAQEIGALVSPGPVARAHANLEGSTTARSATSRGARSRPRNVSRATSRSPSASLRKRACIATSPATA